MPNSYTIIKGFDKNTWHKLILNNNSNDFSRPEERQVMLGKLQELAQTRITKALQWVQSSPSHRLETELTIYDSEGAARFSVVNHATAYSPDILITFSLSQQQIQELLQQQHAEFVSRLMASITCFDWLDGTRKTLSPFYVKFDTTENCFFEHKQSVPVMGPPQQKNRCTIS